MDDMLQRSAAKHAADPQNYPFDHEYLHGHALRSMSWQNDLAMKATHAALNLPLGDDMRDVGSNNTTNNVTTQKGVSWPVVASIAAIALGAPYALPLIGAASTLLDQKNQQPPAIVQPETPPADQHNYRDTNRRLRIVDPKPVQ